MTLTLKLLAIPVLIVLTLSLSAAELSPADKINPSKTVPTLNNQPQEAALKLDDNMTQTAKDINTKSKPRWWNWLTSTSKKPAYFHYIDIIELLD
ncbi:MAG: hypothetical protein ACI9N9_002236 [Enterobacterales bacterium]|jgi:hypothetical protein